ncbi:hypothetical protein DFH08DRAFT_940105 [Mycena albidolilacea]|uniref:Uncharacterized protein n=1 Tax=Mycena albidolilacea TaxID=1033008 RepID=A0AAD7EL86_9AGAR|nr:hypothetical protein DFH08DRAFT_940105 [Mycena albidolilacea]
MEILSMITNSKHPFLSYYYFAWGHSILITLPAGNISRLDSRVEKVGYSVSFAASRFSFVVLASSFTVLELQPWAAGLRFLSEQVLRTENSSSFSKCDIVRDPILHLPFDGRRSRGECGPLRRMNQSRCGVAVLALELEADIKAPAFETSAVHTIVAAFVHVVKGTGLWADVSWVRVWDDAMRAGRPCTQSGIGRSERRDRGGVDEAARAKLVLVCRAVLRVKADGHLARTSAHRI